MAGTTSVPSPAFGPTGFAVPPQQDILIGVLEDLNAAFGGDLVIYDSNGDPELRTPQGQIASSEAAVIGDQDDQLVALFNGVDPAFATGRMQDAIGRIYYITRKPALPTVVSVLCIGTPGVVIPANSQLGADDGRVYLSVSVATIGAGSSVAVDFACAETGPIVAPAGSVHIMRQVLPGWDSGSNPADGIIGQNVETATQFEERRRLSTAQNAIGTVPAVLGSVLAITTVLDALVIDNPGSSTRVLDGVTIPPHSLYVCVAGGSDPDVAMAIWKKKAPGCGYALGNTTVTVTDPSPLYQTTPPTYDVTFQRAAVDTLCMLVTLKNSNQIPPDALDLVRGAVMGAFAGDDGGAIPRIGEVIYGTRFVCPVLALGPWVNIVDITLGAVSIAKATAQVDVTGNVMSVVIMRGGALGIGQTVVGPGIPDGVTIIDGVAPTWKLSEALSSPLTGVEIAAIVADQGQVAIGQAHAPALPELNIRLRLV